MVTCLKFLHFVTVSSINFSENVLFLSETLLQLLGASLRLDFKCNLFNLLRGMLFSATAVPIVACYCSFFDILHTT